MRYDDMMTPTAGSRSSPLNIMTPVHPERMELEVLRAQRRNNVEFDGSTGLGF